MSPTPSGTTGSWESRLDNRALPVGGSSCLRSERSSRKPASVEQSPRRPAPSTPSKRLFDSSSRSLHHHHRGITPTLAGRRRGFPRHPARSRPWLQSKSRRDNSSSSRSEEHTLT